MYKYVKETYKFYSGLRPVGNITCIDSQHMIECLNKCPQMIDNKTIKLADIDLQVIACNSKLDKKRLTLNPDRCLTRYQFLELLIRLSLDKYYKTHEVKMFHEAVAKAFDAHLFPYFNDIDNSSFRWDKLYKEENDIMLTRLSDGIRQLYLRLI